MKILSILFFLIITNLTTTSCSEQNKSVDWWSDHIEQAKEKIKECKKNSQENENCINAKEAISKYEKEFNNISNVEETVNNKDAQKKTKENNKKNIKKEEKEKIK